MTHRNRSKSENHVLTGGQRKGDGHDRETGVKRDNGDDSREYTVSRKQEQRLKVEDAEGRHSMTDDE